MRSVRQDEPVSAVIFDSPDERLDDTAQVVRNRIHLWIAGGVLATCVGTALVTRGHHVQNDDGRNKSRPTAAPLRAGTVYLRPGARVDTDGDRGTYLINIGNSGSSEVTLAGPGADSLPPGLAVDPRAPAGPAIVVLPPGGSASLSLAFRITDCDAIPFEDWPWRLRARVTGADDDAYVEVQPPGTNGRFWQESATAEYCGSGG